MIESFGYVRSSLGDEDGLGDGYTTITFEVADQTLKKIKEFYTAPSQGAAGYFMGMAETEGE